MSRNHARKPQQRGNGWLDPRGTREAHEGRHMEKRTTPKAVGKIAHTVTKKRRAK